MLEPAVRPGAAGGAGTQSARPAFEHRSFEQLLSEAREAPLGAAQDQDGSRADGRTHNPLSGLNQIENAALREVLAQAQQRGGAEGVTA